MNSKDVASVPPRGTPGDPQAGDGGHVEDERSATLSRYVPAWMRIVDPLESEEYDPYNTGAFRVLAARQPRRSLDDMRKLDDEIRLSRKR